MRDHVDSGLRRSYHSGMALWRCPHCGTPQPVAARCWVCRRSSTSCATCRHFRSSVAARIGYCGLDRERRPLAGTEIRGCWDGLAVVADDAMAAPPPPPEPPPPSVARLRPFDGFVLVDGIGPVEPAATAGMVTAESEARAAPTLEPDPQALLAAADPATEGMLWTDLDR
jgi:hypothetical protein